ncbi:MAG: hypothetical protein M1830_008602 [Pleopsidium flavum]|nr:MAG: hypothetical protein M1830_008602 [Pleopsidium flavum]
MAARDRLKTSYLPPTRRTSAIQRWISALQFLFRGPATVKAHYISGESYIPTTTNDYVLISSEKHVKEFGGAQGLSRDAAYDDILGLHYTKKVKIMDTNAQRSIRYRVLRKALMLNIPTLYPVLSTKLAESLAAELARGETRGEWIHLSYSAVITAVTLRMTGLVFFGDSLLADPDFWPAAQRYSKEVAISGEVLQFTPTPMKLLVHAIVTRRNHSRNTMFKYLLPIVQSYQNGLDASHALEDKQLQPNLVRWMVEATYGKIYWTKERIVQSILGSWMGAIDTVSMLLVHALNELGSHPEYIDSLRKEIEQSSLLEYKNLENLPLLDSFLKEVGRMNPSDSISIRRKALQPYRFSDGGPHIPVGAVACVPVRAIMSDEANYQNATAFDGFRFTSAAAVAAVGATLSVNPVTASSRLTDVSPKYLLWGYGSDACPGRFYASCIMKMVLTHILTKYDFKLVDDRAPRTWSWRSYVIPKYTAKVMLQERKR